MKFGLIMKLNNALKGKARQLKADTYALYLALKHPHTPWYAKAVIVLVTGYALSPVDLIPDFIPVLGYIDDLIIIPSGIILASRMIPGEVMLECRKKAELECMTGRIKWVGFGIVVFIWIVLLSATGMLIYRVSI